MKYFLMFLSFLLKKNLKTDSNLHAVLWKFRFQKKKLELYINFTYIILLEHLSSVSTSKP